jgi:FkbM family methyltransferase
MNRIFNLKNVAIIPCAISDKNYYASLYLPPIPFVNISTIVFKIRDWNKIKVKTYKLDSLLKKLNLNLGENMLIKIDAEGAEYKILLGMKNLIKLSSPTIVFECWGDDFLKIRKFLQKKFYKKWPVIINLKNVVVKILPELKWQDVPRAEDKSRFF